VIAIFIIILADRGVQFFKHYVMVLTAIPGTKTDPSSNTAIDRNNRCAADITFYLLFLKVFLTLRTGKLYDISIMNLKFTGIIKIPVN
jgi:hypothetical protein